jgi:hypothetical protein
MLLGLNIVIAPLGQESPIRRAEGGGASTERRTRGLTLAGLQPRKSHG